MRPMPKLSGWSTPTALPQSHWSSATCASAMTPRGNCWRAWLAKPTFVRPMLSGIYISIYASEPLANELKSLHGFVGEVLARSAQGPLDPDTIRSLGEKHALQDYLHAGGCQ